MTNLQHSYFMGLEVFKLVIYLKLNQFAEDGTILVLMPGSSGVDVYGAGWTHVGLEAWSILMEHVRSAGDTQDCNPLRTTEEPAESWSQNGFNQSWNVDATVEQSG